MLADRRRLRLFVLALVLPFVALRLFLHGSPEANFNAGGYNVHHLFTGLLLVAAGGVPLAVLRGPARLLDLCAAVFGIGLSLALDEWLYLIMTDGSDASYLLPVSFWGGVGFVGGAAAYAALLGLAAGRGAARAASRAEAGARAGEGAAAEAAGGPLVQP
jgi:hypothetical protein